MCLLQYVRSLECFSPGLSKPGASNCASSAAMSTNELFSGNNMRNTTAFLWRNDGM